MKCTTCQGRGLIDCVHCIGIGYDNCIYCSGAGEILKYVTSFVNTNSQPATNSVYTGNVPTSNQNHQNIPNNSQIDNDRIVSGRVVSSENGLPVPGVNVIVEGSTNGTITDSNGNYKIYIQTVAGRRLAFSYFGYSKIIPIENKDFINVDLTTERIIRGRVTTGNGDPIESVNIWMKGTTNGTISLQNGYYKISVPLSGGIIVFSFIGYSTKEVTVGENPTIDVQLSRGR